MPLHRTGRQLPEIALVSILPAGVFLYTGDKPNHMKMTSVLCTLVCAVACTFPAIAQSDPDRAVSGTGKLPAGWSVRPDRGTADSVKFSQTGDVYHFTMG